MVVPTTRPCMVTVYVFASAPLVDLANRTDGTVAVGSFIRFEVALLGVYVTWYSAETAPHSMLGAPINVLVTAASPVIN